MELIISIIAVIISFVTFLYTVLVEYRGEQREKKQSTLEALNLLQEQVFDKLNEYTFAEIKDISDKWNESAEEKENLSLRKKEQQLNSGTLIMSMIILLMNTGFCRGTWQE